MAGPFVMRFFPFRTGQSRSFCDLSPVRDQRTGGIRKWKRKTSRVNSIVSLTNLRTLGLTYQKISIANMTAMSLPLESVCSTTTTSVSAQRRTFWLCDGVSGLCFLQAGCCILQYSHAWWRRHPWGLRPMQCTDTWRNRVWQDHYETSYWSSPWEWSRRRSDHPDLEG